MAIWLFAPVLLGTRSTNWKSMEMNTVKLAQRSRHMRQRQTRWTWLHNTILHWRDLYFGDNTYKIVSYHNALLQCWKEILPSSWLRNTQVKNGNKVTGRMHLNKVTIYRIQSYGNWYILPLNIYYPTLTGILAMRLYAALNPDNNSPY